MDTKYNSFDSCYFLAVSEPSCGPQTGLYITLNRGSSLLRSFRFCTASDYSSRDPMTVAIEGSNQPNSTLMYGSSWTLIYNDTTGLDTDPGRKIYGMMQNLSNSDWYTSYRFLITSIRSSDSSTQYAEIQMNGY